MRSPRGPSASGSGRVDVDRDDAAATFRNARAAALFQPLRRRVQTTVDHRFNRSRYDAECTTTDFADRLRDEVDLATVSGDMIGVVGTALHPRTIGVWIRRPGPTRP